MGQIQTHIQKPIFSRFIQGESRGGIPRLASCICPAPITNISMFVRKCKLAAPSCPLPEYFLGSPSTKGMTTGSEANRLFEAFKPPLINHIIDNNYCME